MDTKKLIKALKEKREAEGLSLRKLSAQIGVSFSTLARIERGDGEPDNNSALRILDWLGADGTEAGLEFENVALVHFRASKNVDSKTTRCLLEIANTLKAQYYSELDTNEISEASRMDANTPALSLSKPEMEDMARKLRSELGLDDKAPLNALSLRINGVDVLVPSEVIKLSNECIDYLTGKGSDDWSAMSVPLNLAEDRWAIVRNDTHLIGRQRVTYLEECWHILLGHKLTKVAKIGSAFGRTYESSEEHDAYYLASATLLPEVAVAEAVDKGKTANEIADLFGTSPELVEYRIKRMGLWRVYKSIGVELS